MRLCALSVKSTDCRRHNNGIMTPPRSHGAFPSDDCALATDSPVQSTSQSNTRTRALLGQQELSPARRLALARTSDPHAVLNP
eukprot:scaffold8566_cov20-Tisochrysis_lutea.AAC.3